MSNREQFTSTDSGLLVLAPAKLNLSLLIAGGRPDGYHEIETVMTKIDYYDEILIEPGKKKGIELVCKGPYPVPGGEDNLVFKAAALLLKECGIQAELRFTLTKNIPAGSGLGSASSDAAAVLVGLRRFLNLHLGDSELLEMATALGADVSFFLGGPLALCWGKGEKIEKLPEIFDFSAGLFLPNISVSTQRVYANYRHEPAVYSELSARIGRLIEKNRIDLVSGMCANMLLKSCFELYKALAGLKAGMESYGIIPVCLSGSGSAMFCIINDSNQEGVRKNRDKLKEDFSCRSIIVTNNRW